MTLLFLTNFINHHQVPLADEMYRLWGDNYKMVTFEPLPPEFVKKGFADYSWKPYLVEAFKSNKDALYDLISNADVVIHGAAPQEFLDYRMSFNKLTFRYEERLFKKIDRRFIQYRFWLNLYRNHTRYRNKPLYMLAASAYNRLDTGIIFSYPRKCYKWGYFINADKQLDINALLNRKRDKKISILWCGTLAQVKRPDLVIGLAKRLKKNGIDFVINMIGSGGWENKVRTWIDDANVSDCVNLLGNMSNSAVLEKMREHHIFIFTSDRGEGWGVVLNEAMANGCAVVVSNAIGAAPFLIKDNENGLLFQSGNESQLYAKVYEFISDVRLREECVRKAYETILHDWSPATAANNFMKLVTSLMNHSPMPNISGPCSKAKLIL